jgi:uncharacterized membrane protein
MLNIIVTFHLIAIATALGGRIVFIPVLNRALEDGLNERLDQLKDVLGIARIADLGLILSLLTGAILFFVQGVGFTDTHWAFKLKLVTLLLLITDIGAFHVAQMRVINHFDAQMVPALKRLNTLAVVLMCCMVLFAAFSM